MKFVDDQRSAGRRVWVRPVGPAIVDGFVLLLFAVPLGLFVFGIVYSVQQGDRGLALLMLALLAFVVLMIVYLARDMIGKLAASITLEETGVQLRLAPMRSLIHRPPRCREFVPYCEIRSVDCRLEAYPSFTGTMMQRAYWLDRVDRPEIFLFEDRAIGTLLAGEAMGSIAQEIAQRAKVPLLEQPMAQGRGGIMGVWFTRAPPYAQKPLPASVQARIWRQVRRTANLVVVALFLVMLAWLL